MKDLVLKIAQSLVDNPNDVDVNLIEDGNFTKIEIKVNPDDMGKIIGKHGKIAKALRTVIKACATKDNKRVHLDIIK
ncbi:KH domain-containing protein [Citroniella saccharovorans]|uniref:RNA-binding protein KhpA n=1 Tax=Citroniella saccharovorans TaxID=2053367 RepID=A0AAW9MRA7_9FIRM|nr:KH domain-containing protein [Citroniella saccharovorans]MEB3429649.1 KH domain-containing protein [Citroniella saccharovorans]